MGRDRGQKRGPPHVGYVKFETDQLGGRQLSLCVQVLSARLHRRPIRQADAQLARADPAVHRRTGSLQ